MLLTVCFCALSAPVIAQVNKCKVDEKIVYQATPCATGGETVNLSGAGHGDSASTGSSYYKKEAERMAKDEAEKRPRESYGVSGHRRRGHHRHDSEWSVWGATSINQTITGANSSEQWVYRRGRVAGTQYVYLTDEVVTAGRVPRVDDQ